MTSSDDDNCAGDGGCDYDGRWWRWLLMMMKSGEGAVRLCQMDPQVSVPAANQQQGQTVAPFQMILRWVMAGDELTGHPGDQLEGSEHPEGPQGGQVDFRRPVFSFGK